MVHAAFNTSLPAPAMIIFSHSTVDAVSSSTDHEVIILACSEIFDIIDKVVSKDQLAGVEWYLVKIFGEYLLQNC